MCGIAGGVGVNAPKKEFFGSVLDSIDHRGPDERGTFFDSGVALGICRLAIIDVGTGQQPVANEAKTIHLVFNGEIYNYKSLREVLASKGHKFRSNGDSEVIVHLYEEYGLDFVQKLNGMFAIAIWDQRTETLLLVRDRMGKKPLWYSLQPDGTLLFASEVKALIAAGVKSTLRAEAISEVLSFGYVNAPRSAFNEINQIPPASMGTWQNGSMVTSKYWSPDFSREKKVSFEDAVERTKELIKESVERRLISERPLGSFLSGGYDSSVVTAYMTQLVSGKVRTFSIGFDDPRYDESKYAREVAHYLGTEHIEEKLSPDPALLLQQLSRSLDQPFADSSIIPTFMLAKFARQEVVVALGGDGGDEVFGGYDRYLATPMMQRWNAAMALAAPLGKRVAMREGISNRKVRRILSQIKPYPSLASRYRGVISLGSDSELSALISPNFKSNRAPQEFERDFARDGARDDLSRMLRSDLEWYLPGDLLVKADMATMANSLEVRSPLLDHEIVEWTSSLPSEFKVKGRETKHLLKEIARSLLPSELVDRPKMGFAIPRADWLRTGLSTMTYDLLTDSTARNRGWFVQTEVEKVLADHKAGHDRDNLIWPMLMLELWARNWLDR
ncbi:MAG: asparagine synthase (glutamine-hydrolyzing) [Candidatus Nanopelagicaceae bacterium]|nr:asparagine synthase (glutamine-hydrolyzing) [Candidatus Nanopelagicaceae bacterium]